MDNAESICSRCENRWPMQSISGYNERADGTGGGKSDTSTTIKKGRGEVGRSPSCSQVGGGLHKVLRLSSDFSTFGKCLFWVTKKSPLSSRSLRARCHFFGKVLLAPKMHTSGCTMGGYIGSLSREMEPVKHWWNLRTLEPSTAH